MAHVRNTIRDQIVAAVTGLSTTGANVYKTRVYPLAEGKLPGIAVYTNTETAEYVTISPPRTLQHQLRIAVEVYVKGTTGYDDDLDQISSEIEIALYGIANANPIRDLQVVGFTSEFNGDGDQPVCAARLDVDVMYLTDEGAPEIGV